MAEDGQVSQLPESRKTPEIPARSYKYHPLPSTDSIRLLELQPGTGLQELRCKLSIVNMSGLSGYEALSYMWGDPTETTVIICDGYPLAISANLGTALRQFRHRLKTRIIWADAISIDQRNLMERNQQVPLMSTIYSKADHVLGWIGPDEEHCAEKAFDLLRIISAFCQIFWLSLPLANGKRQAGIEAPQTDPIIHKSPGWSGLKKVFANPYFIRAWVQQELGLAKDAGIYWGEQRVSWPMLRKCSWYLSVIETYDDELLFGPSRLRFSSLLYSTQADRNAIMEIPATAEDHETYTYVMFGDLLLASRNIRATDPRDVIFSLLSHPAALQTDGRLIIEADYTKTPFQVFRDTMANLVVDDLDVLSEVTHDTKSFEGCVSSWVPDFSDQYRTTRRPINQYRCGTGAQGTEVSVRFSDERTTLQLRGLLLDHIGEKALHFKNEHFFEPSSQHLTLRSLEFIREHATHSRYQGQSNWEVTSLVLASGMRGVDLAEENMAQHVANFYAYCLKLNCNFVLLDEIREKFCVLDGAKGLDQGEWRKYWADMEVGCCNSKLFQSRKGYIGTGPAIMEPGDVICIVFGAKIPFVLRPRGDHYLLLGDCYVHGIMQGETVEEFHGVNLEGLQVMDFNIQ